MKSIIGCSLLALALLCSACSPSLRIPAGQIPPAVIPAPKLKTEAEYYVAKYVESENFHEVRGGNDLKRVSVVVERLSGAAGYPPHTFPVHVVDAGEEVNAAAFNGASIVVYTELLRRIKSDDELSVVLGHEMGHILAKHYTEEEEQKSRESAVSIGSSILGSIAGVATSAAGYGGAAGLAESATEASTGMIGYGAFVGSFNRRQEYEADHIGLMLMAKAGYDPRTAPALWKRSGEIFGSTSSQAGAFFNTHPAEKDRQEKLEEAMPLALNLYHPGSNPTPAAAPEPKKGRQKVSKGAVPLY